MNERSKQKGRLVAQVLRGSWRENVQSLELDAAELDEVTPLLYGSGAAGLAWARLKNSKQSVSASAALLQQGSRLLALESALQHRKIAKLFRVLREASISPVLAKGLVAARAYPDTALRPHGDIDILVKPGDYARTLEVLKSQELRDCFIDLHRSFSELNGRTHEQLFARSLPVTLQGEQIQILSNEDHLALLAIHLLKHGAWRPIWLCDIAAAVESCGPQFAWDICLGGNPKKAGWVMVAIALARQLLDAEIGHTPAAAYSASIPAWLVDSVLEQWATPFPTHQPPISYSAPLATYLRHPTGMLKALRERWPNPILATVSVNGTFNDLPRFPYQVGNCVLRAGRFLRQLPERLRTSQSISQVHAR